MYYHGTKKCEKSPNAHEDKYTFWVYSKTHARGFMAKWDTDIPAHKYCNNHIDEGPISSWPRKYICLGHTDKKDMLEAENEWMRLGLDKRDYFFSSDPYKPSEATEMKEPIQKLETKVESLSSLVPSPSPSPDLTIPTEIQSMKECLTLIETKIEALRRPAESESMKEELQSIKEYLDLIQTKVDALRRPAVSESMKEEIHCLETKMKLLEKVMFSLFVILCFILYYALYSKKPSYELELSSRELDI
jgi:hypothetical protein